jgi:hypothetical protein
VRITAPGYQRTFCTISGGPVPIVDRGIIRLSAGTLDDDPDVAPRRHILVDFKAPWFEIADAEDIRNLQLWTGHRCRRLRQRRVFPALLGLLARL